MSTCRWVASDRARVMLGRHAEDCYRGHCAGCQPCTEPHCRLCGITHANGTCAECVAEVRANLREVARLCGCLRAEVEHRGVNGEAMVLLGPTVDPEALGHVQASIAAGRLPADYLEVADHELHPLFVLGREDMIWRDALDHDEPTEALTIASAADYLDRQLTYMADFPHVPFEDFAAALRACVAHLEGVLRDGEQVEKGAPCMKCHRPVTRLTGEDGKVTFRCERCRRDLTDNEYRLAVRAGYVQHADRLCADDLAERIGVPASTVRRWASVRRIQRPGMPPQELPPLLRSCGRDGRGRKVYRVADAEQLRDERVSA